MRKAPLCTLMEALWAAGVGVQTHDPEAMTEARRLYPEQVESGALIIYSMGPYPGPGRSI